MHIKQGYRSALNCSRNDETRSVQDYFAECRLIPQLQEWFPNGERIISMQDGAPCYTAKFIKTLLASKNIQLLGCPGNSPDINPIENLWELVKRKVSADIMTSKQKFTR